MVERLIMTPVLLKNILCSLVVSLDVQWLTTLLDFSSGLLLNQRYTLETSGQFLRCINAQEIPQINFIITMNRAHTLGLLKSSPSYSKEKPRLRESVITKTHPFLFVIKRL